MLLISIAGEEQSILYRYLQERNFIVTAAFSMNEALRFVKEGSFAAVVIDDSCLLDYDQNPITHFRDEILGFSTPIILISSDAFIIDVQDQLRAGVDRHITKPVSLHSIAKVCVEVFKSDDRLIRTTLKTDAGPVVH